MDRPVVFAPAKDRPVLFTAAAWARVLLTLDTTGEGKCRKQILAQKRVGQYAEKAPGAIYWDKQDKRGLSPLELVRRAAHLHPDLFRPGLAKLEKLERPLLESIVGRVPEAWMTPLAREFAVALVCYNTQELCKIPV